MEIESPSSQIKQKVGIFFLLGLLITISFATSCSKDVNPGGNYPDFNENGIKDSMAYHQNEMPSHIQFYVETSGSMNGLYRPKKATKFKHDIWSVLSAFSNIDTVNAFTDNNNIRYFSTGQFRNLMNNGGLNSIGSTVVPDMLKRIVSDLADTTNTHDAGIFVSDMKYSPVGGSATALDQYAIDIRNLFKKYPDFSLSVIGFESEYISPSGHIACGEFPYYMIIVGASNKVAWIRNTIMNIDGINVKGCIDYNVDFACPEYSVIPTSIIGMQRNYFEVQQMQKTCYCLTTYYGPMAKCVVAINSRHFPNRITDDSFTVSAMWPTTKVSYKVKNNYVPSAVPEDCRIIDEIDPDIFIELNIAVFDVYCDVISLSIKDNKQDKEWIEKYYGASQSDLTKTFSIDKFIEGAERAYSVYNLQNQPMKILISKYK